MDTNKRPKIIMLAVLGITLCVLTAGGGYWYYVSRHASTDPAQVKQRVTNEVAAIYNAPGEQPNVASITDTNSLNGQAFFKDAKEGDFVLLYPKSHLIILYREPQNRIMNIATTTDDTSKAPAK